VILRGGLSTPASIAWPYLRFLTMPKFLKPGKVVVLLRGRHAGQKAVIVKNFDEGNKDRKYGHAILAGVERPPLRITKSMSRRKVAKRIRIKPFLKTVNYNHFMPTRYLFDVDLSVVNQQSLRDPAKRKKTRKVVKKLFEERHRTGKSKWFFSKLRF